MPTSNRRAPPLIEDIDASRSRIRVRAGSAFADEFVREDFFAEYEGISLDNIPTRILQMPFLLNVAPVVWRSGWKVMVDEMDERLLHSLETARDTFRRIYPDLAWDGQIEARRIVRPNELKSDAGELVTIFFTGGIDSTYTSLRYANHRQLLVTIWGSDIAPDNRVGWANVRRLCEEYATRRDDQNLFIRTNLRSFLNPARLQSLSRGIPYWHTHVQGGLGRTGLVAPAMMVKRSRRLLQSATHTPDFHAPWGSRPDLEGVVCWAEGSVTHEGFEVSRQEKVRKIVEYVRGSGQGSIRLRPCFSYKYGSGTNCGRCEKCLRTSAALIVEGEDPRGYGLPLSPRRARAVIRGRIRRRTMAFNESNKFFWGDIQRRARAVLRNEGGHQIVGGLDARPFLTWLSEVDFERYRKRQQRLGALHHEISRLLARYPMVERSIRRVQSLLWDRKP